VHVPTSLVVDLWSAGALPPFGGVPTPSKCASSCAAPPLRHSVSLPRNQVKPRGSSSRWLGDTHDGVASAGLGFGVHGGAPLHRR
jgi:hypothetical protein